LLHCNNKFCGSETRRIAIMSRGLKALWLFSRLRVMNLRDLSAILGLSQTTVSRALNGFPEVSEDTRARVRAAAELHGYRPSAAARRLATGQSGTLGVVFPRERNMLGDLLFTEFLGGCVSQASDQGYDITLAMASGAQSEESVYRRAVRSARVDAMILSSPLLADTRLELLRGLNMPFIVHGRTTSSVAYPHLDIDNEGAFFKGMKLLTDLGHTRIALLNFDMTYNFANDRFNGYLHALAQVNIPHDSSLISQSAMTEQAGAEEARRMLNAANPPTAFICSSISQALGVRRAAKEKGLIIGKDISLIAHDDRLHEIRAESFDPPLTATQSSIGDAGKRLVALLIAQLTDPTAAFVSEIWPVDLVVRESTGPLA
jgi:LacI family transcriptional regulator